MPCKNGVLDEVFKGGKSLSWFEFLCCLVNLCNRIEHTRLQFSWQTPVGRNENLKLPDDFAPQNLYCGNLHDIVVENVEPGCLGVEYYDFCVGAIKLNESFYPQGFVEI